MQLGEPVVGPKQRDLCWFCDKPASQTHHTLKQGGKRKHHHYGWASACGRRERRKPACSTCLCIKGYWARFSFYVGGEAESGTPSTSTQHESRGETRKKKRANEIDRNRPERGRIFKPVLCSALSDLPASCRGHYCANCALCLCHVCQKCSPYVRHGDSHYRNMTKVVPSPPA